MRQDQVLSLVRAHAAGDRDRFRLTTLQIAASVKDPVLRDELRRHADRPQPEAMQLLPTETKSVVEPVAHIERSSLVLSAELNAELDEFARERRGSVALQVRGIRPRSRLLFTGPPGCGKTSAASALAGELKLSAYRVHFPGLVGGFMGETSSRIRHAIAPLMRIGALIVFDEIDAIGTVRTAGHSGADREYNVVVSTLLTELDAADPAGVFVATTNRPELLDHALRRRFDDEFEFAAPTDAAKSLLATSLWARFGLEPITCPRANGEVNFDAVAKMVTKAARRRILDDAEATTGAA